MAEFNGKYVVDTDHNNGFEKGRRCYRKDGVGDADSECTIHYGGTWMDRRWVMKKNYGGLCYYSSGKSKASQPPIDGWNTEWMRFGSSPQLVYGRSDTKVHDLNPWFSGSTFFLD